MAGVAASAAHHTALKHVREHFAHVLVGALHGEAPYGANVALHERQVALQRRQQVLAHRAQLLRADGRVRRDHPVVKVGELVHPGCEARVRHGAAAGRTLP